MRKTPFILTFFILLTAYNCHALETPLYLTVEGKISLVGSGPLSEPIILGEETFSISGLLRDELSNLAGSSVKVTGMVTAPIMPMTDGNMDVLIYTILDPGYMGKEWVSGLLLEDPHGLVLIGDDQVIYRLTPEPLELYPLVNSRILVLGPKEKKSEFEAVILLEGYKVIAGKIGFQANYYRIGDKYRIEIIEEASGIKELIIGALQREDAERLRLLIDLTDIREVKKNGICIEIVFETWQRLEVGEFGFFDIKRVVLPLMGKLAGNDNKFKILTESTDTRWDAWQATMEDLTLLEPYIP